MSEPNGHEQNDNAVSELGNMRSMKAVFKPGMDTVISFDPTTKEGAEMLVKATLTELPSLASKVKEHVSITNIFAHPAESIDDKTGEVQTFTRVVVFDESGEAYDCGSSGVLKSLEIVRIIRGNPPWNPGVKCLVRIEQTGGKRQWMTLVPDVASITTNMKQPAKQKQR